jgi:hypothetical protein
VSLKITENVSSKVFISHFKVLEMGTLWSPDL